VADYPWIVALDATHGKDAYALRCLRCGATQRFELTEPLRVDYWCRVGRAFEREHRRCKMKPKDAPPTD
jgi:hypothetical protein